MRIPHSSRRVPTAASSIALAVLLAVPGIAARPAAAAVENYVLDTVHSNIHFTGRHFLSRYTGSFGQFEGMISLDREDLSTTGARVKILTASIDTQNERRDAHLKSPDFFDAEKFPMITFESAGVTMKDKTHGIMKGNLTIRGVTKPVELAVEVLGFGDYGPMGFKAGFVGTTTINRQDFGVKWNRALDNGGTILGDDVEITLQIEATREVPEAEKQAAEAEKRAAEEKKAADEKKAAEAAKNAAGDEAKPAETKAGK
jgi:polyisoprenoid-binding protein YceI